jgi:hypothetical protein
MSQISVATAQSRVIQPVAAVSGATSAAGLIKIQTASAHGLLSNDLIQLSGVTGTVEANGQWTVTKVDSTHFTLNNSTFLNAYSAGGEVVHIGFVAGSALVDNTIFTTIPAFSLNTRLESLSPGSNCRIEWVDSLDSAFVSEQPLALVQFGPGDAPDDGAYLQLPTFKRADVPDSTRSFGVPGGHVRIKCLISGGAFSSAQISAWITF